jgi:hypothetical protein
MSCHDSCEISRANSYHQYQYQYHGDGDDNCNHLTSKSTRHEGLQCAPILLSQFVYHLSFVCYLNALGHYRILDESPESPDKANRHLLKLVAVAIRLLCVEKLA